MPRKLEFDRNEAVAAATETFWEKGYGATSLDDLTERLGIGRASLYNAFGDKRALLLEALDEYSATARRGLNEALASNVSGKIAITSMLERVACCDGTAVRGCMCVTVGIEINGADSEIQRTIINNIERMEDAFAALIVRGQADGSVKPEIDAPATANALAALVVGIHSMKRIGVAPSGLQRAVAAQLALL